MRAPMKVLVKNLGLQPLRFCLSLANKDQPQLITCLSSPLYVKTQLRRNKEILDDFGHFSTKFRRNVEFGEMAFRRNVL